MPESQQPKEGEDAMIDGILAIEKEVGAHVVEVGPGEGRWGSLLRGKVQVIDAIEAWEPYIDRYDLRSKYDRIYILNGLDFDDYEKYNVVILADVLEHFIYGDAIKLLEKIRASVGHIYLSIPITLCEQDGEKIGNPYETHRHQWSHDDVLAVGFTHIHDGPNELGLVQIGTYEWHG